MWLLVGICGSDHGLRVCLWEGLWLRVCLWAGLQEVNEEVAMVRDECVGVCLWLRAVLVCDQHLIFDYQSY